MFYTFLVVLCVFLTIYADILKPGEEVFWKVIYLVTVMFLYIGMSYKLSLCNAGIELYKEYLDKYNDAVTAIQARQHKFMNQINAIYVLFELYDNYEDLVAKQKEEIENLNHLLCQIQLWCLGVHLLLHIFIRKYVRRRIWVLL